MVKSLERSATAMLMRVSVGIHLNDIEAAIETYELMSKKFFTHATPTLFNAGTPKTANVVLFLINNENDSIDGIWRYFLKQTAKISQCWVELVYLSIMCVLLVLYCRYKWNF